MAWYSGIVEKAKKAYNTVDSYAGGYLPGGQTPAQVSAPTNTVAMPTPAKIGDVGNSPASVISAIQGGYTAPATTTGTPSAYVPYSGTSSSSGGSSRSSGSVQPAPQTPLAPVLPGQGTTQPSQEQVLQEQAPTQIDPVTGQPAQMDPMTGQPVQAQEPIYGVSPNGTPLETKQQYESMSQVTQVLNAIMGNATLGEKIMNGDFSSAYSLPSAQGYEGKSTVQYAAELEDFRIWAQNNIVELPGANLGELAGGAVSSGAAGAAGGAIAGSAIGGIGALPGAAGGAAIAAAAYIGNYFRPSDSKEEQKDIREAYNTISTMLPELYKQGLTTEADMLMAEIEKVWSVMESVGEYGQQRNLTALTNEAQDIQIQGRKLQSIALKIKQDAADAEMRAKIEASIASEAQAVQAEADKEQAKFDERAFKLEDLADKRAYDEAQRDEQRAYDEAQQAKRDAAQYALDATETEPSGSSALVFGLLGSGGDTQFVSRDKASTLYFGKVFEELTPAQKKLLMLSKGGN